MLPLNNRTRRRGALAAAAALAVVAAAPATGRAATWSLAGGADHHVPVLAPLGGSKLLVCVLTRCDTWDLKTGAWTTAGPGLSLSQSHVLAHLRDGSLLVFGGGPDRTPYLWAAGGGGWRKAPELPEAISLPQVRVMADGRVVIAGHANLQLVAYVSDPQVTSWSLLAETTPGSFEDILLTGTGPIVVSKEKETDRTQLWKLDASPNRWEELGFPAWSGGTDQRAVAWGDDVLLIATRGDHRESIRVGADGLRSFTTAKLPEGGEPRIWELAAPPGRARPPLRLRIGSKDYVWRDPDQPPVEIPPNPMGVSTLLAAVDDTHFAGTGQRRTLQLLALDDRSPGTPPCGGLERYLEVAFEREPLGPSPTVSADDVRQTLAMVTPACREQVRRGDAPALRGRVRAWSNAPKPGWQELGRTFTCAFAEGPPPPQMGEWLASAENPLARAICITQLPTWPGGEAALAIALENGVRSDHAGRKEVDPALLAAVTASSTSALRNRLGPVLQMAEGYNARGLETLRQVACREVGAETPADLRIPCAASIEAHARWRTEQVGTPDRSDRTAGVTAALTATAIVAGSIVGAHVWRDEALGRGIATGAGALGGMTIGVGLTGLALAAGKGDFWKSSYERVGPVLVGGMLAGGILGGVAAYYLAEAPSSRAAVTAAGLALPYILTIAIAFN